MDWQQRLLAAPAQLGMSDDEFRDFLASIWDRCQPQLETLAVVLAFDGDEAGQKATRRALVNAGGLPRLALLPPAQRVRAMSDPGLERAIDWLRTWRQDRAIPARWRLTFKKLFGKYLAEEQRREAKRQKPHYANSKHRSIAELKAQVAIEDVIGRHIKLRKTGQKLVGLCPFHRDRHPSFVVYPDGRGWWCFGCGEGGDVIDFIERAENIETAKAIRRLREYSR